MTVELTQIKVLLQKLVGEIELSEEKIRNKLSTTEFLVQTQNNKDEIYESIRAVDKRVTSLYIKVAGLSSFISGLIALAVKMVS